MPDQLTSLLEHHWHHLPATEVASLLDSDPEHGLEPDEARRRRERFGPNLLTPRPGKPAWLRFLLQFHQPLIYILLVSAAVTASLREWVDAGVIFGVVLVNAMVGFIQESKAESAIRALARMVETRAMVIRGGTKRTMPSAELVPGDVVVLAAGDKVPADLRLFRVRELAVDESALTGESVPVAKHTAHLPRETLLADRANMAYAGALVTGGAGAGLVIATGDSTETGRISSLIATAPDLSTPLTRKIKGFSAILLYVILGLAAFTFIVGLARGEPAAEMFMAAVALAVGAIPEGLPAAITITLAIGVSRMAERRAIIRKLPAVEALGSTTVICSDKTGTLTENQMTVQEIFAGGERYAVTGAGYAPAGEILKGGAPTAITGALRECLAAGLLCNDAALEEKDGHWSVSGDPTEGALITAARKGGLDEGFAANLPRDDAIPFESRHQYMATLHGTTVYIKGAVERLLERCDSMLDADGNPAKIDPAAIEREAARMAGRGLRVLAFALGRSAERGHLEHRHLERGLTFLGLMGMIDPPRPAAVAAVRACKTAGIAVKMITGDHAVTAAAIAAQIGLADGKGATALTGRELANLSNGALRGAAVDTSVFARVEPEQKLRLVKALQAEGHIVAMTGDGVNDAPALRSADIGIAMGITGTDVAKEAADVVLTDDNFASVVAAAEEGRGVFDNLVKFITWTLPTNFGEGLVLLAAIAAGVTLPITPLQILWINMTTAVLLGLTLAFEPIEPDVMLRPPRHPQAPILTRALVLRIFIVAALLLAGAFGLFLWEQQQGKSIEEARTVAVNVFVMGELFYLFNCRSMTDSMFRIGVFSNPWLWTGVAGMIGLQILFTYLPLMNRLFHSAPMDALAWAEVVAVGLLIYLAIGLEKWIRGRAADQAS